MSWKFEWYYFGDIITLLEAPPTEYRNYLIWRMLVLSEEKPANLIKILKGKTQYEHNLFKAIRNLPQIDQRRDGKYKWKKKFHIDLKIYKVDGNTPEEVKKKSFLTPREIYLPWPFPIHNGKILADRTDNNAFDPAPLPAGTYIKDRHLLLDHCLGAIDKLLFNKTKGQAFADEEDAAKEDQRNGIIKTNVEDVLKMPFTIPEHPYFCIYPHSKMPSDETYLEMNGTDKIVLHLGLKLTTALAPGYARWPNGAWE